MNNFNLSSAAAYKERADEMWEEELKKIFDLFKKHQLFIDPIKNKKYYDAFLDIPNCYYDKFHGTFDVAFKGTHTRSMMNREFDHHIIRMKLVDLLDPKWFEEKVKERKDIHEDLAEIYKEKDEERQLSLFSVLVDEGYSSDHYVNEFEIDDDDFVVRQEYWNRCDNGYETTTYRYNMYDLLNGEFEPDTW